MCWVWLTGRLLRLSHCLQPPWSHPKTFLGLLVPALPFSSYLLLAFTSHLVMLLVGWAGWLWWWAWAWQVLSVVATSRRWSTSTPEEQLAGNLLAPHHGCTWDTSWTGGIGLGLSLSVGLVLDQETKKIFQLKVSPKWSAASAQRTPKPDLLPSIFFIPDLIRFSFENHQVAGNPKYQVLHDISGKPKVWGITRYFGYCQTWLGIGKPSINIGKHWI